MAQVPPLVGRDEEQARLLDALERCASGAGGLVLVSGEAGIGKSRLLREVLLGWQGRLLSGAAVAGDRAYAPLGRAFATHEGVRRGSPGGPVEEAGPETVLDSLRRLVLDEPTVVVLEDLHLADAASIGLMPVVARTLTSAPVLVLATYRTDALPRAHPLRAMRAELRRAGLLVDIALRPLTEQQTAQLLTALVGGRPSSRLVSAVHHRTEGLPLFVEEIAAALVGGHGLVRGTGGVDLVESSVLPLPESVRDAVVTRTADLHEQHGAGVDYAATLGVVVDLAALASLTAPSEVDALLGAGLLIEVDGGVGAFRHALVREALYRAIPWGERRERHRRAAEVLTLRGAAPGTVAEHWMAAHEPGRARPLLLAAVEEHCAAHAYRDAATLAARALTMWPEDDDPVSRLACLERLAGCVELSGEPSAAATAWADVARRYDVAGDLAKAGAAHRRAANAAELVGDLSRTVAERGAAARAFAGAGALGDAAAERLALAEQLNAAGRLTDALDHAAAATEAAESAGRRDLYAHALAFEGAVRSALGQGPSAVELARSGLELALSGQMTEALRGRRTTSSARPWSTPPTTQRPSRRTSPPSSCAGRRGSTIWPGPASCACRPPSG